MSSTDPVRFDFGFKGCINGGFDDAGARMNDGIRFDFRSFLPQGFTGFPCVIGNPQSRHMGGWVFRAAIPLFSCPSRRIRFHIVATGHAALAAFASRQGQAYEKNVRDGGSVDITPSNLAGVMARHLAAFVGQIFFKTAEDCCAPRLPSVAGHSAFTDAASRKNLPHPALPPLWC